MRDAFISYGRAESKAFATKLHNKLREQGLNVWFDQNDIPLGVDFQAQIDDGIDRAKNFLYIIAPHAIKSEYCLKEVVLAIKRHKRIIPILHVEPTSKEVWDKMHPLIGKLNWIYMREKEDKTKPLHEWEQIDDFEVSFKGLISLIERHQGFVQDHTQILIKALDWERRQKDSKYLLSGYERKDAVKWLLTEWKNEQAPCVPSDLHAEYICESIKHAEEGLTDVFIIDEGEENDIRNKTIKVLSKNAITVWQHDRDIKSGQNFEEAVREGIENADNFMFLITKSSVKNATYLSELAYAQSLNKRIIPLLIEKVDKSEYPESLRSAYAIDFTDNTILEDYFKDFNDILIDLRKEKDYFFMHKSLLNQALLCEKRPNLQKSLLLRGHALDKANIWLDSAKKRNNFKPLDIHYSYIKQSVDSIGLYPTEIFIAFSSADSDFAKRLNRELKLQGKVTWFDHEYLLNSPTSQQEIMRGIEESENFIYIISPNSVRSSNCAVELAHASKLNKRIITVVLQSPLEEDIPPVLASIPSVDFEREQFGPAFTNLLTSLNTDRAHIRSHRLYTQQALEWDQKGHSLELLLRGKELSNASDWLKLSIQERKQPPASDLQKSYIEASKKYAKQIYRRRLVLAAIFLVVSVLAIYATFQKMRADEQKSIAEQKSKEALIAKDSAEVQRGIAINNEAIAKVNALLADQKSEEAFRSAEDAKNQKEIALHERSVAMSYALEAESAKKLADRSAAEALKERDIAEKLKVQAQENEENAKKQKARADTLKSISESKALAIRSYALQMEESQKKIDLARKAFELHKEYSHNRFDADLYNALFDALISLKTEYPFTMRYHLGEIRSLTMDASGKILYSGGGDGFLYAKNLSNFAAPPIEILKNNVFIRSIGVSPDHKYLAAAIEESAILILEPNKEKKLFRTLPIDGKHWSLRFTPDGSKILFTGSTGYLYAHDIALNKTFIITKIESTRIRVISIDNTGTYVIGGTEDGRVYQWEIKENQPKESGILLFQKRNRAIMSLIYNPSSKLIAIGLDNGGLLLFDPKTKSVIKELSGHKARISYLKYSNDGSMLATASFDGSIRIWDMKAVNSEPIIIDFREGMVQSVAFSPDGKTLYAGYANGTIRIFPIDMNQIYEELSLEPALDKP